MTQTLEWEKPRGQMMGSHSDLSESFTRVADKSGEPSGDIKKGFLLPSG
jgi:hypothetical protein